ncbi:protein BatD [Ruficoccus amylovorans]|uniref:Protein BatD n=1 Tax=Ruficoccus amylovorans TaxID=1804625 RepID=A0A842HBU4_9BACT|nr:BatD family protein [Ruficoccus amylovorans]MBC2592891.1 protein BatD [Ruficoccus amylovorans]
MRFLTGIFLSIFLCGALSAQDVRVESSFEPSIMHAGETGIYRFTVSKQESGRNVMAFRGFDIDFSAIRGIPGLQVSYLGPSQNVSIINSQTMVSVSHQFRVRADEAGEFTLPAFPITLDGKSYTVPAATLKVLARSQAAVAAAGQSMQMELILPRDKIYVGESLPVQIRLYIRRDIQVSHLGSEVPVKIGDAFAVSDFSDPAQRQVERNGEIYQEVVWQAVVTPYKAGDYPLVFQEDVYAYAPEQNRGRSRDPFESIFNRIGMRDVQKVSLYTNQDEDLKVLDLPAEGRPADFSGAVGIFRTSQPTVDPTKAQVGEPMTLSFNIEGSGNFDRFSPPVAADSQGWRVYNPEETFAPTDRYRYQGRMTYNYVIIPRDESVTETPEVTFNYFNPDTEKYVELKLPPRPVTITPPPPGQRPNIPPPTTANQPATSTASRHPELLPIKTTVTAWGQSMRPLFLSPWFLGAQVVPLGVLVGLALTRRRHNRLLTDPRYAREVRARKLLKPRLAAARKAATSGDHAAFYAEAQRVIQCAVGRLVDQTSEALLADEIDALLTARSVDPAIRKQTQDFLHAGDALKFGGLKRADIDLPREMSRLETLATQLMKLS